MGVLYDYFAAESDEQAEAVLDWEGGPGFGSDVALDVVQAKAIDPIIQVGKLAALLSGREYDQLVASDDHGRLVGLRDGGERLVLALSDEVLGVLAEASPQQLADVAEPWSQIEEFWGFGDPEFLAGWSVELGALAQRTVDRHQHLYCWVCV